MWGRWNAYAKDGHGGNAILKRLLTEHPERRGQLQYSILRILDHNVSRDAAVKIESTYKRKLDSHAVELHEDEPDYGRLNAN